MIPENLFFIAVTLLSQTRYPVCLWPCFSTKYCDADMLWDPKMRLGGFMPSRNDS